MRVKKVNNEPLYMQISHKKTNGIVYTSQWIVNIILDHINYNNNIYEKKVIDPSCGEGSFLGIVVERFLKDCYNHKLINSEIKKLLEQNIYGFDIDKEAILRCK